MRVTVVVCVCVCVSVTVLAAIYLIYKSQVRCYKVPYGVCIVWISLKMLHSLVLSSFASFMTNFRYRITETVMASF